MYDDGEGMGKMASEQTMMVTTAPEFADSEDGARSVAENTGSGMDIGAPVTATDANDDALIYALGGTDTASFDIDPATGQLMTKEALDYETKATYSVTVIASDSGGLSDSIDVTITVTNEDEAGRVTFWRDGVDATTAAIMVGDMLGGLAEDPDGNVGETPPSTDMYPDITGATWQWARTTTPAMMDSWMDITGATAAAYDGDGRRRRISPAGDGDVRRRGRHGQDGLGADHDGDHRPRIRRQRGRRSERGGEHGGEHGHRRPRDGHGR